MAVIDLVNQIYLFSDVVLVIIDISPTDFKIISTVVIFVLYKNDQSSAHTFINLYM